MTTLQVVWWLLALSGVVQIVTQSTIFEPVRAVVGKRSRFLGELISCPLCFAVWCGGGLSLIGFGSPSYTLMFWPEWAYHRYLLRVFSSILDGAALSLVAYGWVVLRGWLSRVVVREPKPDLLNIYTPATPAPREVNIYTPATPAPRKAPLPPCPLCERELGL